MHSTGEVLLCVEEVTSKILSAALWDVVEEEKYYSLASQADSTTAPWLLYAPAWRTIDGQGPITLFLAIRSVAKPAQVSYRSYFLVQ